MVKLQNSLYVALLLETVCVTYALNYSSLIPFASILYLISGLAIVGLMICLPVKQNIPVLPIVYQKPFWRYQLVIIFLAGLFIFLHTRSIIQQFPLRYTDADMLPIMEVMARRFMQGNWHTVYSPIQEIWNGIQPIYLPAMWLPLIVSVKFGFDPRWITSFCILLTFVLFVIQWRPHFLKSTGPLLLLVSGLLLLWLYTEPSHNFIRLSEEGIVVAYYAILVIALLSEQFLLIGFAAALCLLSRYTIAPWIPAMLLYMFLDQGRRKKIAQLLIPLVLALVILVILPFGWEPLQIAITQPEKYVEHALRVWKEHPEFFWKSVGLARFFGPEQIALQHKILLTASFLLPVAFVGITGMVNRKNCQLYNLPLATLKLTVVIVLVLIDVPYQYLYYTSSFISLLVITAVTNNALVSENA